MTIMTRILAAGTGIAALAAAAPAAAQYAYPYGYASPYGAPYGNAYGYRVNTTQLATQQCMAAVQQRLNNRGSTGILASIFGLNQATSARVLSVTQVNPRRSTVRVRGLATSGRMAYNPYGVGYYGSSAYAYQPDLSFSCSVDYQGRIRDVDINRR